MADFGWLALIAKKCLKVKKVWIELWSDKTSDVSYISIGEKCKVEARDVIKKLRGCYRCYRGFLEARSKGDTEAA